MNHRAAFAFGILAFLSAAELPATVFEISVSDDLSRGWINSDGTRDSLSLGNYILGKPGPSEYRNFFIFDLSAIPLSEKIVDARLVLRNTPGVDSGGYLSTTLSSEIQFFQVDRTLPAALRAGFTGDLDAFQDLRDGATFSAPITVTAETNGVDVSIPLNATFLTYAQDSLGGEIVLSGAMVSVIDPSGYATIFGASHRMPLSYTRLVLTTTPIPEPSAWAALCGVLALIAAGFFRQQTTRETSPAPRRDDPAAQA